MSWMKRVERLHALLDALGQPPPFRTGDDTRHDVEGDQPLGGLVLAIDGKGDALPAEAVLRLLAGALRVLARERLQPISSPRR
jgi:hypothetical protein